jgi:ABC-type branched-subunit amino acid transport system ATPase component
VDRWFATNTFQAGEFSELGALVASKRDQGLTILLAEQGVEFSLSLADRVYVLEKGAIRHSGPAAQLRDDKALLDRLLSF